MQGMQIFTRVFDFHRNVEVLGHIEQKNERIDYCTMCTAVLNNSVRAHVRRPHRTGVIAPFPKYFTREVNEPRLRFLEFLNFVVES